MKTLRLLSLAALICIQANLGAQDPIRIMPMGNSLTYDENLGDIDDPRPDSLRVSYRKKLYELMDSAGYSIDFTGNRKSGYPVLPDELADNAGFPGIKSGQLCHLLKDGWNMRDGTWETTNPGQPYLQTYPADIILLHIGTNDLENVTKAEEAVSDLDCIFDEIDEYEA